MERTSILKALQLVLCDTYVLYVKTQTYHWNVTGPHFYSDHLLLESQYEEMIPAIDRIAERMRTLGATVPANLAFFKDNSQVQDELHLEDPSLMIKDLIKGHEQVIHDLQNLLRASQSDGATETLAADRLDAHEKARWMLQSSLQRG